VVLLTATPIYPVDEAIQNLITLPGSAPLSADDPVRNRDGPRFSETKEPSGNTAKISFRDRGQGGGETHPVNHISSYLLINPGFQQALFRVSRPSQFIFFGAVHVPSQMIPVCNEDLLPGYLTGLRHIPVKQRVSGKPHISQVHLSVHHTSMKKVGPGQVFIPWVVITVLSLIPKQKSDTIW